MNSKREIPIFWIFTIIVVALVIAAFGSISYALIPRPPMLEECTVEISDAALASWQSHDTALVCSSPGYREALTNSNHAMYLTEQNLNCVCSDLDIRIQLVTVGAAGFVLDTQAMDPGIFVSEIASPNDNVFMSGDVMERFGVQSDTVFYGEIDNAADYEIYISRQSSTAMVRVWSGGDLIITSGPMSPTDYSPKLSLFTWTE